MWGISNCFVRALALKVIHSICVGENQSHGHTSLLVNVVPGWAAIAQGQCHPVERAALFFFFFDGQLMSVTGLTSENLSMESITLTV